MQDDLGCDVANEPNGLAPEPDLLEQGVAMTAPTIDCQLMCACEWAYAITGSGPVPPQAPYDGGSGLVAPVQGFATGSNRIDAALVGSCTSGVVVAFRGTLPPDSPDQRQTLDDWLRDLEIGLATGNGLPGRVHQGFLGALDALWPDVLAAVTTQMARFAREASFHHRTQQRWRGRTPSGCPLRHGEHRAWLGHHGANV